MRVGESSYAEETPVRRMQYEIRAQYAAWLRIREVYVRGYSGNSEIGEGPRRFRRSEVAGRMAMEGAED